MVKALKGRKVIQEDIEPCELSFSEQNDIDLKNEFIKYHS